MTVALAVLAALVPGPCAHRRYTVHAAARGIRATFHPRRRSHPLDAHARDRVRRYERCAATNAHGHRFLRTVADRQARMMRVRLRQLSLDRSVTPYVGPDGRRWAIPWPIVFCESRGENLPPNADDASGYYQALGSTFRAFGGRESEAYLAPKAEQDAVAHRIWTEGGPEQWSCSSIVGWVG